MTLNYHYYDADDSTDSTYGYVKYVWFNRTMIGGNCPVIQNVPSAMAISRATAI